MNIKSPRKIKQQRIILLLALYILKNYHGNHYPQKRKVLRFIQSNGLIHVPSSDEATRSTGDFVWENDLAWKREDLKEDGLLRMPEHGVWQITEYGEHEVELWAQRAKEMTNARPEWRTDFEAHFKSDAESDCELHWEFYITEKIVEWAIKIATR
jgi:hypothetical protein